MTFGEFDLYCEALLADVRRMRDTKGKEYTEGSTDRFANFNVLAGQLKLPRTKVWQVYFAKHLSAIYSYIENEREFSNEGIRGRITDAITYLTLLGGMIDEDKSRLQPGVRIPYTQDRVHAFDPQSVLDDIARNNHGWVCVRQTESLCQCRCELNGKRCVLFNGHPGGHIDIDRLPSR